MEGGGEGVGACALGSCRPAGHVVFAHSLISLAHHLHTHAHAQLGSLADAVLRHVAGPEPQVLSLSLQRRVPLEGAELEAWEAAKGEAELAALAAATAQQQPQSQQPQSQQVAGAVGPAAGLAGVGAAAGGAPPGGPFAQASGSASAAAVGVAGGQAGPLMPPLPTGLLPLRSNSSSISCLVKDPVSGLMMQQLGSPRASSFRGQGQGAGAGAEGAAAGSQAQAPMALDVLMDGFVPPQVSAERGVGWWAVLDTWLAPSLA